MVVGTLREELYLVALPENCKFTVTKLENNHKDNWLTYFGSSKEPPYVVNPISGGKALVVESGLSSTSIWDSGEGLSNTLHFTVSGTISNKQFEKKGYITFSSTAWSKTVRPDYSILLYGFDNNQALSLNQKVPPLLTPDPYYIAFAIKDEQICMIASCEHNLTNQVISTIVEGILTAHTKALGWVFGKLW